MYGSVTDFVYTYLYQRKRLYINDYLTMLIQNNETMTNNNIVNYTDNYSTSPVSLHITIITYMYIIRITVTYNL